MWGFKGICILNTIQNECQKQSILFVAEISLISNNHRKAFSQNSEGAGFLLALLKSLLSTSSPYLLNPPLPPLFFLLFLNCFFGFALSSLNTSYSTSFSSIYVILRISFLSYSMPVSLLQSVIHTAILSNYGFKFMTRPATKFSGNCSPIIAKSKSSQYLEVCCFYDFTSSWHPVSRFSSSHTGFMVSLKTCKNVP